MAEAAAKPGSKRTVNRGSAKNAVRGAAGRDLRIVRTLAAWFEKNARALPWRTEPRRAYPSLVSELMLQQTQVSRVLEKFGPFMERFATVEALARADEAEVMAAWSGLGYYRRARLLQACAKTIVREHEGTIAAEVEKLKELPGIGRYTAGAIASIVFGEREAIVDGNVCRVLQRLEAKEGHAGDKKVVDWAWRRAEELVAVTSRGKEVARFNEGLMELGATVCTPDGPKCGECPLAGECGARAGGCTATIPAAKPRAKKKAVHHDVVVVYRKRDGGEYEFLLEQRPERGLWAGLWQPPSRESGIPSSPRSGRVMLGKLGLAGIEAATGPGNFVFHTTHREVRFRIWAASGADLAADDRKRKWVAESGLGDIAISNAHRTILVSVASARG